MGDKCMKDEWRGQCCCSCKHHRAVMKHPWNKNTQWAMGSITEQIGYGCDDPLMDEEHPENPRQLIFMEGAHGMCEMYEKRDIPKELVGFSGSVCKC